MNNRLISLIRTDMNITFGISSLIYNIKYKKKIMPLAMIGIAILALLPSYLFLIKALGSFYDAFKELGQESYFLHMGFMTAQLIVLILGFMYVLSKYYFSNDLSQLVPLPIKPSQIIGSKFAVLMVSEYLTSLPVILPFVIIYGTRGNEGISYWVMTIVSLVSLPVLPLALASITIMLFMKYTNIKGKRDLIRTIGTVLLILLIVLVQIKINQWTSQSILQGDSFIYELAMDSNYLLTRTGIAFPTAMWGAKALIKGFSMEGLINIMLFVGSGFLGFMVMLFLSERIFFDGLIGNIEYSAAKGRKRKKEARNQFKGINPSVAMAKKELTMILKTPVYLMNSLGGVIILPALIAISMMTGGEAYAPARAMIMENREFLILGSIGVIASFGLLNSLGSTTFSREGSNMWIQRTLPIEPKVQIIGRTLSSVVVQVIGGVLLLAGIMLVAPLNIVESLTILMVGVAASVPLTMVGMAVDIIKPMVHWTNPQQAMKQNINVLISIALGTMAIFIVAFITFAALGMYKITTIIAIYIALIVGSTWMLYKYLERAILDKLMDFE